MDLELYDLPKVYKNNNKEYYLDQIKLKFVHATPEETIRQLVITYIQDELEVPKDMICVEEALRHYQIKTKDRADIVIDRESDDGSRYALAVIECKASTIPIDDKAIMQALGYAQRLDADYLMVTNGIDSYAYILSDEGEYFQIDGLPVYQDMLERYYYRYNAPEPEPRIPYENLEDALKYAEWDRNGCFHGVCRFTPKNIGVCALNFSQMLSDIEHKLSPGDYGPLKVVEDLGCTKKNYGNASGGSFFGSYRSFLVEYNGNTNIVSFLVSGYYRENGYGQGKTCIVVSVENNDVSHNSLEYVLDTQLILIDKFCCFVHKGYITVGKFGRAKVDGLRDLVTQKAPNLTYGNGFNLGILIKERLWHLDDPSVENLITNMMLYALIRDEYREIVKREKLC